MINAEPIYRVRRSGSPNSRAPPIRVRQRTARVRISAHPDNERIDSCKLERLPATAESFFGDELEMFDGRGRYMHYSAELEMRTPAESFFGDELEMFRWTGTLYALFCGTRDENSPLVLLYKHEATIVREIHSYIANKWAGYVKLTVPAALVGNRDIRENPVYMQFNHGRCDRNWRKRIVNRDAGTTSSGFDGGFVAFARCGHVKFPEPTGQNVNMMPFIFGDKDSLPTYLQYYFPLIERCPYMKDDIGKVGYLTVHESYVDVGKAQRREGLHIESPGTFADGENAPSFTPGMMLERHKEEKDCTLNPPGTFADGENAPSFTPGIEHHWGSGCFYGPDKYDGGIFMASSVADTSEVWDALVDNRVPGIVDRHGGCEHLRHLIGQGTKLRAGELVWMTDCTPHEALPQKESGHRHFFRVVTPCVSHWYADHSTCNPKVPLPSNVTVVEGDKFV
eukprot:CAMPEP_0201680952 /NCGR_PEP_ID=MMETSP0494-20130426/50860_1 /ASSEMBLY_ACC=CAM_ASM_000839 /TAXON_ID=420259 /ORGANISM="Thalassiosira gravida, Strain GMp14c1" /LENGTH=451 /DNA_ID=CAMNT_0048164683 /DNA_START=1011 /DNA_END=2366 /DNA_ORIENTATION=-